LGDRSSIGLVARPPHMIVMGSVTLALAVACLSACTPDERDGPLGDNDFAIVMSTQCDVPHDADGILLAFWTSNNADSPITVDDVAIDSSNEMELASAYVARLPIDQVQFGGFPVPPSTEYGADEGLFRLWSAREPLPADVAPRSGVGLIVVERPVGGETMAKSEWLDVKYHVGWSHYVLHVNYGLRVDPAECVSAG